MKNIQDTVHTSNPKTQEQSKTEDGRRVLAGNIESIEAITNTIRSLQIERAESPDMDDHLMLDFTTNLAHTMPSILEGNYETRLATVLRLSKTSEESCLDEIHSVFVQRSFRHECVVLAESA